MLLSLLLACNVEGSVSDGKPQEEPTGTDNETTAWDDTAGLAPPPAIFEGNVLIQLYTIDEEGNRTSVAWDPRLPRFPYGQIYVAAYNVDQEAGVVTLAQDVIRTPSERPNPFHLEIDPRSAEKVFFYAVLDYAGDAILSPTEPTGLTFGRDVVAGTVDNTVALIIDVEWDPSLLPTDTDPGSGGGVGKVDIPKTQDLGSDGIIIGGGGQELGEGVNIQGTLHVSGAYTGGRVAVMAFKEDGSGPYYSDWTQPQAVGNEVTSNYQFYADPNFGPVDMRAAWDSNRNGLIDPSDAWGEYADSKGTSLNPLTIGSENIEDVDVYLPLGQPLSAVPWVLLSGTMKCPGGCSQYPTVWVAALKNRPTTNMATTDIVRGYDSIYLTGADLNADEVKFNLAVPSNTYTYVIGAADADNDGVVLEDREPLAFWDGGAAIATGHESQKDLSLELQAPPEGN